MNTFTFTDNEVTLLVGLIDTARGVEAGSPFLTIKEKLERKPSYIVGEYEWPELSEFKPLKFSVVDMKICTCEINSGIFTNPTVCVKCNGRIRI